ncbi:hypothetical protein H310_05578 [Aphanomyces invadans]|uniref:Uncharacterized protein n=1 Tax=Aphanomyces invadans TaxID=157072 RepID=A0A024UA58_9STRA|nr:hypothetical protein H310_05578 [Aphanomyces invadans]ETW03159.1 hypothetical protein H310_05578 [Aphanomyces invadans]|eukprot:XP_008868543.1 hypothetical protein H310_05578 [Aphanomyces invadans]
MKVQHINTHSNVHLHENHFFLDAMHMFIILTILSAVPFATRDLGTLPPMSTWLIYVMRNPVDVPSADVVGSNSNEMKWTFPRMTPALTGMSGRSITPCTNASAVPCWNASSTKSRELTSPNPWGFCVLCTTYAVVESSNAIVSTISLAAMPVSHFLRTAGSALERNLSMSSAATSAMNASYTADVKKYRIVPRTALKIG